MIIGSVNDRLEPTILLQLRGPSGISLSIEAVIDTGYTGMIVLPQSVIDTLQPFQLGEGSATLADGSVCLTNMYLVELLWDSEIVRVVATGMGNESLVGMKMLVGHDLSIEVRIGGRVQITESGR